MGSQLPLNAAFIIDLFCEIEQNLEDVRIERRSCLRQLENGAGSFELVRCYKDAMIKEAELEQQYHSTIDLALKNGFDAGALRRQGHLKFLRASDRCVERFLAQLSVELL